MAMVVWTLFLIPRLGPPRSLLFFVILATSGEWYRHAAHARVDMLLAGLVSLSLLVLFQWTHTNQIKLLIGAGILMALAALTKGPVGVALPVIITLCAMLLWKKFKVRKLLSLGVTAGVALMPLLAWYSAEMLVGNNNLIDIVLHENLDRLLGKMSSSTDPHTHGPLYLIGAFFVGLLPWSFFAALTVPFFIKRKIELQETQEMRRFIQWCLLSIAITVVIFLIPDSKRGVYLLPIYPASAALLTVLLYEFAKHRKDLARKGVSFAIGLLALLCFVALLLRLNLFDFQTFVASQKTADNLLFYIKLLRHSWLESSAFSRALQVVPLALITQILLRVWARSLPPLHSFGVVLALVFIFFKITFVAPAAAHLSPKRFIAQEISDHHPPEMTLLSNRMYAEAFYIRQADPHLTVKNYSDSSTHVLFWEEDESLLPQPLYIHRSEENIKKPGKHLEFAIVK